MTFKSNGNIRITNNHKHRVFTQIFLRMNNYIVRSSRDVIVITKFATRRTSKAQSKVMY